MRTTGAFLLAAALVLQMGSTRGSEAEGLIRASGQQGGICLIVGANDLKLTEALARKGFYAQVLQPDARRAAEWGAKCAVADWRENAGVRAAAFEAEHYGTNLFNLIVVEDPAALGKAKLADLCRILVPKGLVAFRKAPGDLAGGVEKLKMAAVSVGGFAGA
ncbi:MAG: hypothetical protein ACYTGB_13760, partial [Planctomycetota bacterium]